MTGTHFSHFSHCASYYRAVTKYLYHAVINGRDSETILTFTSAPEVGPTHVACNVQHNNPLCLVLFGTLFFKN